MNKWIKTSDTVLFLWSAAEGFTGEACIGERLFADNEQIWRSANLCDGLTEEPIPPTHWQPMLSDFVNLLRQAPYPNSQV